MYLCSDNVFGSELAGYQGQSGELWTHGLLTAIASRELAKLTQSKVNPEIAYTAGLLHDVGKAVISEYMKNYSQEIFMRVESGASADFLEAERAQLETDHCEVGVALAEHWRLTELLKEVIGTHHAPATAKEEFRGLAYVVHLGDFLAMMSGAGTGADAMRYKLDSHYTDWVSIKKEELEHMLFTINLEFEKTVKALSMSTEGSE